MLDYLLSSPLLYLFIGIFALVIGSFLNVVIYRVPLMLQNSWRNQCLDYLSLDEQAFPRTKESFNLFRPRSHCPKCQVPVKWYFNIPLLGYLLCLGHCSNCKKSISLRYPLVELLSCLLALYLTWHFGWSWQLAFSLVFTWLLISLIFIDFDHQLLPDSLTYSLLWLGLIANSWQLFCPLQDAVIGVIAGYLSFWTVANLFKLLSGRDGMGYGDFKLLAALGAWVGWQILPFIIIVSSLLGAVVGISLILFKGHKRETPIPFGPYLALAGWIALFWGKPLMNTYTQIIY
jgi:leader peptidase (prepilin peptidase)/N-methyltransferase